MTAGAVLGGSAALVAGLVPAAGATTNHRSPHGATVPLIVYSAQGYDKIATTAFEKATGIKVELNDNSTGPLRTQIEATKNNPTKWGLLWVDGSTAFAGLDSQHLLLRGWEPKVQWDSLGTESIPKDKSYVPTGVTLAGAMAYNVKKVPHPPTSWSQLLSAKWKGQVGTNDPTQSGPTYPFIAGMFNYLGGVSKGESYFRKLKANGLVINPTNGPTLAALASGQINIALIQSSAAVGGTFNDSSIKVRYLDPVTMLPGAIGINAKASAQEQKEAKEFATWVLSKAGQHAMQTGDPTGDSLYYPVVKGTHPLAGLPSLRGVGTQTINPYTWGVRENTINNWFVETIEQ